MTKHDIEKEKSSQTEEPPELRDRHRDLTSEATPEETVERLRSLPERARRLRELIDASREAYSR
jgi:hypothetical protein